MLKKLKSLIQNDQFFFSLLIFIVGVISFVLGYLSNSEPDYKKLNTDLIGSVIVHEEKDTSTEQNDSNKSNESLYVGSKSGDKYHLVSCPGAKKIKEANKVFFKTVSEAESAGYKPAANCPGLN